MQVSIGSVRPAWIKSSSEGRVTAYREHINQRPTLTYREHTRPTGGPMNHLLAHPRVQGAYSCDSLWSTCDCGSSPHAGSSHFLARGDTHEQPENI